VVAEAFLVAGGLAHERAHELAQRVYRSGKTATSTCPRKAFGPHAARDPRPPNREPSASWWSTPTSTPHRRLDSGDDRMNDRRNGRTAAATTTPDEGGDAR
jgi:hypothetical protein